MLAAGDTFRAAAIEQLEIWGERTKSPVISGAQGADAAGLVYEALAAARAQGIDVLIVDTAGRLQNKAGLMDELHKIVRVMKKLDPAAPHAVLLVLDATVGQNALSQVEEFSQDRRRDRARHDQARWHRARRHSRRHRRQIPASGALHRGRRGHRRSRAVRGARLRPRAGRCGRGHVHRRAP